MGLGMLYVCVEWCLQAHLSTEDYANAMKGLKNAQRFRRLTFRLRWPASAAVLLINRLLSMCRMRKSHERKTLVWTKNSRYKPSIRHPMLVVANAINRLPFAQGEQEVEVDDIEKAVGETRSVTRPEAAPSAEFADKEGRVTTQLQVEQSHSQNGKSPTLTRSRALSE
jgi:hypothetical protein